MNNKTKSLILFAFKLTLQIITLLIMVIFSRSLNIELYGDYKKMLTAFSLIISILAIGIPSSILYFLSEKNLKDYFAETIISAILMCLIFVTSSPIILKYFNYSFNTFIFTDYKYLIIIITCVILYNTCLENIFIVTNNYIRMFIFSIVANSIMIISFYMELNTINLKVILEIILLKEIIKFLVLNFLILKYKKYLKRFNLKKFKKFILFGIPIGTSSIIGMMTTNIDKLVAGKFLTNENFAILTNGSFEIPILSLLSYSVFNILILKLKKEKEESNQENLVKLWYRIGLVMLTMVIPLSITFCIFGKEIILILFGNKYIESTTIFQIYQLKTITRIYLYGSIFIIYNKSKLYSLNAGLTLFINLILDILLVGSLGAEGLALATVLCNLILVIIQNYQLSKIMKTKIRNIYPCKEWVISLVICTIIGVVTYYIYSFSELDIKISVIFIVISLVIQFGVLSKLINNEVLELILRYLKRGGDNKKIDKINS